MSSKQPRAGWAGSVGHPTPTPSRSSERGEKGPRGGAAIVRRQPGARRGVKRIGRRGSRRTRAPLPSASWPVGTPSARAPPPLLTSPHSALLPPNRQLSLPSFFLSKPSPSRTPSTLSRLGQPGPPLPAQRCSPPPRSSCRPPRSPRPASRTRARSATARASTSSAATPSRLPQP